MTLGRLLTRIDRAGGGTSADLVLYALSAAFALVTAATSTLLPHRAWGAIAAWVYAAGFVLTAGLALAHAIRRSIAEQTRIKVAASTGSLANHATSRARLLSRLSPMFVTRARAGLIWLVWGGAALIPLVVEAVQRAGGRTDRAQEEVLVVERMGERLLHDGSPYLARDTIAALPADERLMGYSPYQPGMAVFGLPRAVAGDHWWTDARVWFAVATAATLLAALRLLAGLPSASGRTPDAGPWRHDRGREPASTDRTTDRALAMRIRAIQAATVLPICALTLATGGDDIPVLLLCLLALALAATDRYVGAGLAVGAATAGKLFALPVLAVLVVLAIAHHRGRRLLPGALGLPILVLVPPMLVDAGAVVENVLRFPLGHGVVTSPAQSPFPGYLIAQHLPGGRIIAAALLVAVAGLITVRIVRRPPPDAAAASLIIGLGLLAAILLMPTTRFGYLLYPIAFLVWYPALQPVPPHAHSNHTAPSRPVA